MRPTNGAGGGLIVACGHDSLFRTRRNFVSDSFVSSRWLSGSLTLVRRLPRNGGDSRRAVSGEKNGLITGNYCIYIKVELNFIVLVSNSQKNCTVCVSLILLQRIHIPDMNLVKV